MSFLFISTEDKAMRSLVMGSKIIFLYVGIQQVVPK